MLNLASKIPIFVYTAATDMRKGVNGLSGIVRSEFKADPTNGSLFIFINRQRDRMKILHFDGGGFWLYYRLLRELAHTIAGKDETIASKDETIAGKDRTIDIQSQTITLLEQEKEELELAFNQLLQRAFGNRSERYLDNPDQLRLDFQDSDEAADAALGLADAVEDLQQTIPEHQRRKPAKKRDESLPAHFPRYEVVATVSEETKTCREHGERTLLPEAMWDKTETLEFERPKARVRVTKYPKYACQNQPQCGIASPERPPSLVEGNKYDTSIAAEIITGKYAYHMPLYRLQDYFAGSGWTPSRSTQCNILSQSYSLVEPLLDFFKTTVQNDPVVGTDDTGLTLLYPKTLPQFDLADAKQRRIHEVFTRALANNQPSIHAHMWAYRGTTVKLNVFDFTVSRHRDGPELFFADYQGTLLGDCWSGFEAIAAASAGNILRAACNSHARRKIRNSTSYPQDAAQWLRWYQQLYDIEDRGKTMTVEERLRLRQSEAVPIWQAMGLWLDEVQHRTSQVILPKSDFAQALQYIRNHFEELQRYLADGRVPIDNNDTEQLMKQVALGRKNWRAPDVPSRTSGRRKARDALLAMFGRTVAVWSAICI